MHPSQSFLDPEIPWLMGIVNLTPDSFSDGGQYLHPEHAYQHAQRLIAEGANIVDVGASSTRPHGSAIPHDEEWKRLAGILPDLIALAQQHAVCISVDTYHARTAERALELGVSWINDVGGGMDPRMWEVMKQAPEARYVWMHHLGLPVNPTIHIPLGQCPVASVVAWGKERLLRMEEQGIDRRRCYMDPGIGFGKTAEQSFALLRHISRLRAVGVPLLVGHSRKSFLARVTDVPAASRDAASHVVSAFLAQQQVEVLRVHDVAGTRTACQIAQYWKGGMR